MRWVSSIKVKLTLWNALVVMLIYAIAATLIYFYVKTRLETLVVEKLEERLNLVTTLVYKSGGDENDWHHLGTNTPVLIMEHNRPVFETTAWGNLDYKLGKGPSDYDLGATKPYKLGERQFVIKSRQVRTGVDTMHDFLVFTAIEKTDTLESIDGLAAKLSSGIQFILILALIGGHFMANRALKTVDMITQKLQAVTASSLSERLPVFNPDDEIGKLSKVINDLLARLERSFEQLKQFTADASHEFRTPLTSIKSMGQVALQNKNNYRETIESILEETEHLEKLINNLLILTRGDNTTEKIILKDGDIVQVIKKVINDLEVLAEEKNITINFMADQPVYRKMHMSSLRQALTNIIHNSIQYTPKGGSVEISMDIKKDLTLEITDTGRGIPQENLDKIFERFYRIDQSRSKEGMGLGLSIAKQAIELNQGTVQFLDYDKGAKCRIRF